MAAASLDSAATGAPALGSLVCEVRRPPLLLPRPLVEAGAIYSEGIEPFFVLERASSRRTPAPSILPEPAALPYRTIPLKNV
ncbi:hypothetical protein TRIUR3_28450 [Triticum urartu]|uniref:Uncharacterized protein n=1 Tax=Triticum urartu TaxID=4572 RepID=M7YUY5_TRIUA|nr:hypothetical protein TRIUR3_28450 [Triticum urartu]